MGVSARVHAETNSDGIYADLGWQLGKRAAKREYVTREIHVVRARRRDVKRRVLIIPVDKRREEERDGVGKRGADDVRTTDGGRGKGQRVGSKSALESVTGGFLFRARARDRL